MNRKFYTFRVMRETLLKTLRLPEHLPRFFSAEFKAVTVQVYNWKERDAERNPIFPTFQADIVIRPSKQDGTIMDERWGRPRLRKVSNHRVFVICPCCRKQIPSGRLAQHFTRADHVEMGLRLSLIERARPQA